MPKLVSWFGLFCRFLQQTGSKFVNKYMISGAKTYENTAKTNMILASVVFSNHWQGSLSHMSSESEEK